jgi:hypothetical protein
MFHPTSNSGDQTTLHFENISAIWHALLGGYQPSNVVYSSRLASGPKREELMAVKNEIYLSNLQISGGIWIEKVSYLREMMLELYKQQVRVDRLDPLTTPKDS